MTNDLREPHPIDVGDSVVIPGHFNDDVGTIVECRGNLGPRDVAVYRVEFQDEPGEPREIEVREDQLRRVARSEQPGFSIADIDYLAKLKGMSPEEMTGYLVFTSHADRMLLERLAKSRHGLVDAPPFTPPDGPPTSLPVDLAVMDDDVT